MPVLGALVAHGMVINQMKPDRGNNYGGDHGIAL